MKYYKKKILVIGDKCEDIFIYGTVDRIAPEAPVPVFKPGIQTTNDGMAANVAANLRSLGHEVMLLSNHEKIKKTRLVYRRTNQLLLRIDENDSVSKIDDSIIYSINNNVYDGVYYDAIIISDYNKGFLSYSDIAYICDNNDNVFIDTKKHLGDVFANCSFIKINEIEYESTKDKLTKKLIDKLIVTLSGRGCMFRGKEYPTRDVEVKDLSGAGDTFLAAFVAQYLKSKNVDDAIEFAQECATEVVQKYGVSII